MRVFHVMKPIKKSSKFNEMLTLSPQLMPVPDSIDATNSLMVMTITTVLSKE
ncbi:Uncharacterised protein [Escherichia coli]|nr:Uncharacterised protein [Escherichia coli]